jgi:hypothetical protein
LTADIVTNFNATANQGNWFNQDIALTFLADVEHHWRIYGDAVLDELAKKHGPAQSHDQY